MSISYKPLDNGVRRQDVARDQALLRYVVPESLLRRVQRPYHSRSRASGTALPSGAWLREKSSVRESSWIFLAIAVSSRRWNWPIQRWQKWFDNAKKSTGKSLFQFVDEDHTTHSISSTDVNDALRDMSGLGQRKSIRSFRKHYAGGAQAERKRKISAAVEATAKELGNTKAVCQSSYIHPGLLAAGESGELSKLRRGLPTKARRELTVEETRFLAILPKLEFT